MKLKLIFLLMAIYFIGCGDKENSTTPPDDKPEVNGVWGWGKNLDRQLFIGDFETINIPTKMSIDSNLISVALSDDFTFVIKADGTLWNYVKQTQIESSNNWRSISAYYNRLLAIKTDGSLWEIRYYEETNNYANQIGIGKKWKMAVIGEYHSLAIQEDGSLWAWGLNDYGKLGNGEGGNKDEPTQVGIGKKWKSIGIGLNHSIGLQEDGSLWAWGYIFNKSYNLPKQINPGTKWNIIDSKTNHFAAIDEDGSLWAWGQMQPFAVYSGSQYGVELNPGTKWKSVSLGVTYGICVQEDGSLWAWGDNANGQLGNGKQYYSFEFIPELIDNNRNWRKIYSGNFHNIAIRY